MKQICNIDVCIDTNSFKQTAMGTVSGAIWLEIHGKNFPEKKWNDLVLAVLAWWLFEIRALSNYTSRQAQLRFLDGPFLLQIDRNETDMWDATFKREYVDDGDSLFVGQIDFKLFLASLLTAARLAIDTCKIRGIDTGYIDEIRSLISELEFV